MADCSLGEAFTLATFAMRASGLFPFTYNERRNRFEISRPFILVSVLHLAVYGYVNLALLLEDWQDYVQPLVDSTGLNMFVNLVLRLLGMVSTIGVLLPALFGSRGIALYLNHQLGCEKDLFVVGLDIQKLCRRQRAFSLLGCAFFLVFIGFNSWHAVYFFRMITQEKPSLMNYLVIALANFYRFIFILFLWLQLFCLYSISSLLNRHTAQLVREERVRFQQRRRQIFAWQLNVEPFNT